MFSTRFLNFDLVWVKRITSTRMCWRHAYKNKFNNNFVHKQRLLRILNIRISIFYIGTRLPFNSISSIIFCILFRFIFYLIQPYHSFCLAHLSCSRWSLRPWMRSVNAFVSIFHCSFDLCLLLNPNKLSSSVLFRFFFLFFLLSTLTRYVRWKKKKHRIKRVWGATVVALQDETRILMHAIVSLQSYYTYNEINSTYNKLIRIELRFTCTPLLLLLLLQLLNVYFRFNSLILLSLSLA